MDKLRKFFHLLFNKPTVLGLLLIDRIAFLLSDKTLIKLKFRLYLGYWIDLDNPKTFCEKLQWLKLHNRKSIYTKMVDKISVKDYVSSIIGSEYIIPTIATFDSVEEIDWNVLPNQFVIKCAHDSGGIVVCKDKSHLDIEASKRKIKWGLNRRYYYQNREWPYKNVPRRILAEQYINDDCFNELFDYKFYCFDGKPMYCQVIRDRFTNETIDFYDMDWNHLPFVGLNQSASNGLISVEKPDALPTMIDICSKLSSNIPFVRIDLYYVKGMVYFGEITFFPASGFGSFTPEEWNSKLGKLINIV